MVVFWAVGVRGGANDDIRGRRSVACVRRFARQFTGNTDDCRDVVSVR